MDAKELEELDTLDVERGPLLVLDESEEELVVDDKLVLRLEEYEDDEELRKLVEIVIEDETLESDVDELVLELPRTLDDDGSTLKLAPQTPELLLAVPSALCI